MESSPTAFPDLEVAATAAQQYAVIHHQHVPKWTGRGGGGAGISRLIFKKVFCIIVLMFPVWCHLPISASRAV